MQGYLPQCYDMVLIQEHHIIRLKSSNIGGPAEGIFSQASLHIWEISIFSCWEIWAKLLGK